MANYAVGINEPAGGPWDGFKRCGQCGRDVLAYRVSDTRHAPHWSPVKLAAIAAGSIQDMEMRAVGNEPAVFVWVSCDVCQVGREYEVQANHLRDVTEHGRGDAYHVSDDGEGRIQSPTAKPWKITAEQSDAERWVAVLTFLIHQVSAARQNLEDADFRDPVERHVKKVPEKLRLCEGALTAGLEVSLLCRHAEEHEIDLSYLRSDRDGRNDAS